MLDLEDEYDARVRNYTLRYRRKKREVPDEESEDDAEDEHVVGLVLSFYFPPFSGSLVLSIPLFFVLFPPIFVLLLGILSFKGFWSVLSFWCHLSRFLKIFFHFNIIYAKGS